MFRKKIGMLICAFVLAATMAMPSVTFAATSDSLPSLTDKSTYRIPDDMNYSHWCMTYANMYLLQRKLVMMGSLEWNSFRAEDIREMTRIRSG